MRSFAYKNSVWKTSWYQKQNATMQAIAAAGKNKIAGLPEQEVKPEGKGWFWTVKSKSVKAERKV